MADQEIFYLSNGIPCVFHPTASIAGHLGIVVKAGTRFEKEKEHGIAHFIEHCIFKGTQKRKTFHILNRLDSVGGELNAFTGKEDVSLYASFINKHFSRSAELLSDIVFNSKFPSKEIMKEKEVVKDEILYYEDQPSELIFDDFEELLFRGHQLEHPVLGTTETIDGFNRSMLLDYWNKALTKDNIIISISGNYELSYINKHLEKYFGQQKLEGKTNQILNQISDEQFDTIFNKDVHQSHCLIGSKLDSGTKKEKYGRFMLNNILGGPALNARLVLNIREKYGLTYHIESLYVPYKDWESLQIYFGCDPKHYDKVKELVYKEINKLKNKKLGVVQLQQAKEQLKGQIALARENYSQLMIFNAKNFLDNGLVESMEDIEKSVDEVSASDLLTLSNSFFDEQLINSLTYWPK